MPGLLLREHDGDLKHAGAGECVDGCWLCARASAACAAASRCRCVAACAFSRKKPPATIVATSTVTATPMTTARSKPELLVGGRLAGEKVYGTHRQSSPLVLDPEPDCDRERTDLGLVDRLGHFEPAERIAEPNRHAELARELLRQAGEVRAAAGEDDLADGEAPRLRLVVGQ